MRRGFQQHHQYGTFGVDITRRDRAALPTEDMPNQAVGAKMNAHS